MDWLTENFLILLAAFGLAVLASLFWLIFWYHYSERYTTPRKLLLKALILGVVAAIFVALIERIIFIGWFPEDILAILYQERTIETLGEILLVFSIVLFFIALPEELLKFLFFKTALFNSPEFNQIIDGVKFGLVLGLGFALAENTYVFFNGLASHLLNLRSFLILFFLRLLLTTLAQSLYGAILGYYFGLAKFYKIFQRLFLTQGILTVVIMHNIFNFFTLTPFSLLIFVFLVTTLIVVMKWYTDRRNFQIIIAHRLPAELAPPILTEKKEMEALVSISTNFNLKILKKIGLCPFCLKRIKKEEKICLYCHQKVPWR